MDREPWYTAAHSRPPEAWQCFSAASTSSSMDLHPSAATGRICTHQAESWLNIGGCRTGGFVCSETSGCGRVGSQSVKVR